MTASITQLPALSDSKSSYRVAAKLRAKKKRGKALTPEQTTWLMSYEAAHPSPRKGQDSPSSPAATMGAQPASLPPSDGTAQPAPKIAQPSSNAGCAAPSGGGGLPPPIDLGGGFGAAPATPGNNAAVSSAPQVSPAHEQQCAELAAQFCMMFGEVGKSIEKMGGTPLSPEFIGVMIGPSMKRILLRHMPQDGSGTEYLDYGVVFGGCMYQGQSYLKAKKALALKQRSAHVSEIAAPIAPIPRREGNPIPSDFEGPPMPHDKIDPGRLVDDESYGESGSRAAPTLTA